MAGESMAVVGVVVAMHCGSFLPGALTVFIDPVAGTGSISSRYWPPSFIKPMNPVHGSGDVLGSPVRQQQGPVRRRLHEAINELDS